MVADPFADNTPGAPARLDWDATLAFRRHLWAYGLGVADAMDTAQRGMGLTWDTTAELIRRSAAEAAALWRAGRLWRGHRPRALGASASPSLDDVTAAYEEQLAVVEDAGAQPILMASRHLAAVARDADDYRKVYGRLLGQVRRPVILHWLGPMFDPALTGYWGSANRRRRDRDVPVPGTRPRGRGRRGQGVACSTPTTRSPLRSALPAGVRLYTGDDFNYPDADHLRSDALLGIFAAIAPAAATALAALDAGDTAAYDEAFGPTVPLARHLFGAPTYYYKTGICSWPGLPGHQDAFAMVGGLQSARSVPAPGGGVPARRPGRPAARPGPGRRPDAGVPRPVGVTA